VSQPQAPRTGQPGTPLELLAFEVSPLPAFCKEYTGVGGLVKAHTPCGRRGPSARPGRTLLPEGRAAGELSCPTFAFASRLRRERVARRSHCLRKEGGYRERAQPPRPDQLGRRENRGRFRVEVCGVGIGARQGDCPADGFILRDRRRATLGGLAGAPAQLGSEDRRTGARRIGTAIRAVEFAR
jgi:hypothetical protein